MEYDEQQGAKLWGIGPMHFLDLLDCLASITFPGQRQLFLPINDNYKLYESGLLPYTEP
jgi:hypothetical protein